MFNFADGGEIPVPADRLPVLLPENVEMERRALADQIRSGTGARPTGWQSH
jgi:hypothetical protein